LIHLKNKNLNQLKGGSKTTEFFCTYSSYQVQNQQIFPDSALNDPQLISDSPINLRDPELLKNPSLLPQIRLLHHDKNKFELTFEILLYCTRMSPMSRDDRSKVEEFF